MSIIPSRTSLMTKLRIRSDAQLAFAEWQSRYHSCIAVYPGFIDIEIFSPSPPSQFEWVIVQSFTNPNTLMAWQKSSERQAMIVELTKLIVGGSKSLWEERIGETDSVGDGVTQVFVTKVSPDKEQAYRDWSGKLHEAEALAPGFRRVYVQAPSEEQPGSWVTLLQFDTQQNLDRWLTSKEHQAVLEESKEFVTSVESHRVASSFAGWFNSANGKEGIPPVWKQTMLVLLVLFPIVMLELKFFNPLVATLNPSLGTFIGNAISVSLISWPMMPIACRFLYWWLTPKGKFKYVFDGLGLLILGTLYLAEIALFWNLLS